MKNIIRMNDGFLWLKISKNDARMLFYYSDIPVFSIQKDGTEFQVEKILDIEDANILAIEIGFESEIKDFEY